MFSGCRKLFSKIHEVLNLIEESTTTLVVDWSMLPCDMLCEIALKLDSIDDFIHFSAVCHSWNNASSEVKPKQYAMPWLLLAENTKQNPNHLRKIYNLTNNKCYQLSMPETFGARCWGSCNGWLVILTSDIQMHLFNPLTKQQITSLPSMRGPLSKTQGQDEFDESWSYNYWMYIVSKIVVLQIPQSNDLLVAVIYGPGPSCLSLARPGDQAWTLLIEDSVEDVTCCGDFIYVVSANGNVSYFDIMRISDLKDAKVMDYVPGIKTDPWAEDKVYILNLGGDLLLVSREKYTQTIEDGDELGKGSFTYVTTTIFEVFRVDSKSRRWVEIQDFGNFSIFVGYNHSMSIPTTGNLKPNCIYFGDDDNMFWKDIPELGGLDTGIYDMKTGEITHFYQGDDASSTLCPPLFFVPSC